MSEDFLPTHKPCSNCGGIVPADSSFCKHCAFNFAEPAQPSSPVPATAHTPGGRKYILLACGLAGVLALTLAGIFAYKNWRGVASPAPIVSQTMSDMAKQVESKILKGENLSNNDLGGLSAYELRVLRNVHFARYGRTYDRPGLGDYFATCSWYKPDANYNDNLLTALDKTNINLILALENQVKAAAAAAATASATNAPIPNSAGSSLSSMFNAVLTTEKVQRAVDAMADWTRKGGAIRVGGVQELPQQNQARADLQFDDFLYNATDLGTPVSKDKAPPPKPDRNSPNFWADLSKSATQQVRVTRYAGNGVAVLKHYNDGRWVLTQVQFGMHAVNGNIEIR